MNDFLIVFNKQGRILADIIDKRTDVERSDLDIYPLLTNCTLDIICGIASFNRWILICHRWFDSLIVYLQKKNDRIRNGNRN